MEEDLNLEEYARGYALVDLDVIQDNLLKMHKQMNPDVGMIAVIKTDAYGHGSVKVAQKLSKLNIVHGFAVATAEEALELRENDISLPIMILGYTFPYSYKKLIQNKISSCVFRFDEAKELSEEAMKQNTNASIYIKVDTGMGRIGIMPDEEGFQFVKEVNKLPGIRIDGIFTHFARADEKEKDSPNKQYNLFKAFTDRIEKELSLTDIIKECANSAAILTLPNTNMNVVRAGIAMYGLSPSKDVVSNEFLLKPAMSIKSHIVFIKWLEAGYPISYGGTYVTKKKTKVATIPIGYGDGYPRSLSNKGYVLIHGKKAPIIGRICMDQFMVDVTEILDVLEGDLVTIVGRDGKEEITIDELGELSGRFNYEFLCDISKRIPRVYRNQ